MRYRVALCCPQRTKVHSFSLLCAIVEPTLRAELSCVCRVVARSGGVKGDILACLVRCTVNCFEQPELCPVSHPRADVVQDLQALLANFGIFCRVKKRRDARLREMPDGHGGSKAYPCAADYELIIDGESRERFMGEIGFLLPAKTERYNAWRAGKKLLKTQRFASRIASIEYVGDEAVFDTTQADHNAVIFNGLVTGQCGEQPLPPYGSCLLGSINLTTFVRDPFGPKARFDMDDTRGRGACSRACSTTSSDQRAAARGAAPRDREQAPDGMGFLGLGRTLTMLKMRYGTPEA